ncbi:hypothetical protein SUGI_0754130 [Cryptomeria japonica]|uniref:WUSCHEL-related homeobox 11-like n=1 Tax=Cryptomeria japonica TaxID=3369 RepID=UPI002414C517|nr:WUSCHEL-related homeobox 11-like [Cryptomeria japonica]GLJ37175.1 hypothetical protein SUGI_0754130 [Cryptomeria japonica]
MVFKRHWTDMFKVQPSTLINQGTQMSSHSILNRGAQELRNPEPKARWNPTKEQIEILESIYTSGKIKPSRDDIRMIRIQLLEFGEVEEANVFYWFQNRKSKNRKRQRRLNPAKENGDGSSSSIQASTANPIQTMEKSGFPTLPASISSFPNQQIQQNQQFSADPHINLQQAYPLNHYRPHDAAIPSVLTNTRPDTRLGLDSDGLLNVMIDGMKFKAPRGPINVKAAFGPNVIMMDSAYHTIPTDERGFSVHGLQEGGDYYLLSNTGGAVPLAGFPQV